MNDNENMNGNAARRFDKWWPTAPPVAKQTNAGCAFPIYREGWRHARAWSHAQGDKAVREVIRTVDEIKDDLEASWWEEWRIRAGYFVAGGAVVVLLWWLS